MIEIFFLGGGKYTVKKMRWFENRRWQEQMIRKDRYRYRSYATMSYYRISHFFYRKNMKILAYITQWIGMKKTGNDISFAASIDKSTYFPHPIGIVIGGGTRIEKNVTIYSNVIVGGKPKFRGRGKRKYKYPRIREGAVIYGNSCLIGDIVIEKDTIVGAGSVVLHSTDTGGIYAGCPARKIIKENVYIGKNSK